MVDIPIEVQLRPFILLLLILSIVNMVILFNKTNENIGNKREVRAFRGMLLSLFARHGCALTGESPEHAQIVGSV
ncbi:hypothetical protein SAMN02910382_03786 [Butyrivibrio sp. TB]|nr:hypothetical protein SAMN02910382_03786 [Butyrivibrio sp. TB]